MLSLRHSVPNFPPNCESIALCSGIQRRALPRHHSEELQIINISFRRVGFEPTFRVYNHPLCSYAKTGLELFKVK